MPNATYWSELLFKLVTIPFLLLLLLLIISQVSSLRHYPPSQSAMALVATRPESISFLI